MHADFDLSAIAYSTGTTPPREMAVVGIVVGVVGTILLAFYVAPLTWGFIGVMWRGSPWTARPTCVPVWDMIHNDETPRLSQRPRRHGRLH